MVGKLAPNSSHLATGLVKYVPGRGYFRAVPSQNGDIFATSPPRPPTSTGLTHRRNLLVASIMDIQVMYVNARGMRYKHM